MSAPHATPPAGARAGPNAVSQADTHSLTAMKTSSTSPPVPAGVSTSSGHVEADGLASSDSKQKEVSRSVEPAQVSPRDKLRQGVRVPVPDVLDVGLSDFPVLPNLSGLFLQCFDMVCTFAKVMGSFSSPQYREFGSSLTSRSPTPLMNTVMSNMVKALNDEMIQHGGSTPRGAIAVPVNAITWQAHLILTFKRRVKHLAPQHVLLRRAALALMTDPTGARSATDPFLNVTSVPLWNESSTQSGPSSSRLGGDKSLEKSAEEFSPDSGIGGDGCFYALGADDRVKIMWLVCDELRLSRTFRDTCERTKTHACALSSATDTSVDVSRAPLGTDKAGTVYWQLGSDLSRLFFETASHVWGYFPFGELSKRSEILEALRQRQDNELVDRIEKVAWTAEPQKLLTDPDDPMSVGPVHFKPLLKSVRRTLRGELKEAPDSFNCELCQEPLGGTQMHCQVCHQTFDSNNRRHTKRFFMSHEADCIRSISEPVKKKRKSRSARLLDLPEAPTVEIFNFGELPLSLVLKVVKALLFDVEAITPTDATREDNPLYDASRRAEWIEQVKRAGSADELKDQLIFIADSIKSPWMHRDFDYAKWSEGVHSAVAADALAYRLFELEASILTDGKDETESKKPKDAAPLKKAESSHKKTKERSQSNGTAITDKRMAGRKAAKKKDDQASESKGVSLSPSRNLNGKAELNLDIYDGQNDDIDFEVAMVAAEGDDHPVPAPSPRTGSPRSQQRPPLITTIDRLDDFEIDSAIAESDEEHLLKASGPVPANASAAVAPLRQNSLVSVSSQGYIVQVVADTSVFDESVDCDASEDEEVVEPHADNDPAGDDASGAVSKEQLQKSAGGSSKQNVKASRSKQGKQKSNGLSAKQKQSDATKPRRKRKDKTAFPWEATTMQAVLSMDTANDRYHVRWNTTPMTREQYERMPSVWKSEVRSFDGTVVTWKDTWRSAQEVSKLAPELIEAFKRESGPQVDPKNSDTKSSGTATKKKLSPTAHKTTESKTNVVTSSVSATPQSLVRRSSLGLTSSHARKSTSGAKRASAPTGLSPVERFIDRPLPSHPSPEVSGSVSLVEKKKNKRKRVQSAEPAKPKASDKPLLKKRKAKPKKSQRRSSSSSSGSSGSSSLRSSSSSSSSSEDRRKSVKKKTSKGRPKSVDKKPTAGASSSQVVKSAVRAGVPLKHMSPANLAKKKKSKLETKRTEVAARTDGLSANAHSSSKAKNKPHDTDPLRGAGYRKSAIPRSLKSSTSLSATGNRQEKRKQSVASPSAAGSVQPTKVKKKRLPTVYTGDVTDSKADASGANPADRIVAIDASANAANTTLNSTQADKLSPQKSGEQKTADRLMENISRSNSDPSPKSRKALFALGARKSSVPRQRLPMADDASGGDGRAAVGQRMCIQCENQLLVCDLRAPCSSCSQRGFPCQYKDDMPLKPKAKHG